MTFTTTAQPSTLRNDGGNPAPSVKLRKASQQDAAALRDMHRLSLRAVGPSHYSPPQLEGFLQDINTVDEAILADGTFYVAEVDGRMVASCAWTLRPPAYAARLLQTEAEPDGQRRATIRSVFTHPGFVRRGLASTLMRICEEEAVIHGMATRIELHATLPAAPLYERLGYRPVRPMTIPLSNNDQFAVIFMVKPIASPAQAAA